MLSGCALRRHPPNPQGFPEFDQGPLHIILMGLLANGRQLGSPNPDNCVQKGWMPERTPKVADTWEPWLLPSLSTPATGEDYGLGFSACCLGLYSLG